ncbi:MAG: exonuclease SbcCD subunit D [Oscillospiraceae bacterium]
MKIIHTADWHIGRSIGEHSMLEDQRAYLKQLATLLRNEQADALVIAGDLYDRSVPPADAVQLVDETFSEIVTGLGIPILAIAGNHDSRRRLSFANRLLSQQGLYLEGEIKKEIEKVILRDSFGPVNFYLLPFLQAADVRVFFPDEPLHSLQDAYNLLLSRTVAALDRRERNVLVSHGFFAAAEHCIPSTASESAVGGSDLIVTDLFQAFDYVALGHIHSPQNVGLPQARYAGSILKYAVDEAAQRKQLWCVELGEGHNIQITDRTIQPMRDLRILRGDFDELLRSAQDSNQSNKDYVFAELTQSEPVIDAVARLRAVYPNILGLKYTGRSWNLTQRDQTADTLKSKSPSELFADFYKELTGESLPEQKREIVKQTFEQAAGMEVEA